MLIVYFWKHFSKCIQDLDCYSLQQEFTLNMITKTAMLHLKINNEFSNKLKILK